MFGRRLDDGWIFCFRSVILHLKGTFCGVDIGCLLENQAISRFVSWLSDETNAMLITKGAVRVNQKKTGEFLKRLRKDKGLTQEQLAEHFCISSRTVSRWETGSNMPDVEMLIELADFYDADVREIIDGERKSENMDSEEKDTLKKVAEYVAEENKKLKYKMIDMMGGAAILLLFGSVLVETNAFNGNIPESAYHNYMSFTVGAALAVLGLNILYLLGVFDKISQWKKSRRRSKH